MSVDDPRARDMLRAYRSHHALDPERGAAIWDRLEGSLDGGAVGPRAEDRPPAPWHLQKRWIAVIAIAAGVLLALAIAPRLATQDEPAVVLPQALQIEAATEGEHAAEIREPVTPPTMRATVPPIAPPTPTLAPIDPEPPKTPRRPRRSPPPAAQTDDLVVEFGLIRRARRALQDGDPKGALAMLDAHAHAFPRGQMLEDRLALRVEALCAAGSARQARAEARELQRRFPGSTHALEAACPSP